MGLGHESNYYQVLHTYADDEYTKRKTSLIRPPHGLPSKYSLPFSQTEISCLGAIPLISIDSAIVERSAPPAQSSAKDLYGLDDAEEQRPVQRERSMSSAPSVHSSAAMSMGSHKPKSSPPSTNNTDRGNRMIDFKEEGEERERPGSSMSLIKDVASSQKSYASRSQQQQMASSSKMESWEMASPKDSYSAPPMTGAWDAPQEEWQSQPEPQRNDYEHREPYRRNAPHRDRDRGFSNSNTWRPEGQSSYGGGGGGGARGPSRRLPVSYQGTWDDRILDSEPRRHTGNGSMNNTRGIEQSSLPPEICINVAGCRIDVNLPRPSPAGQAEFEGRSKDRKLCNEHHIRNACPNDSTCHFDHEPISAAALLALRHTARRIPCNVGPACRRPSCFYGHHCPYGKGGLPCSNKKCAFIQRGMHRVTDLHIVETINPDESWQ